MKILSTSLFLLGLSVLTGCTANVPTELDETTGQAEGAFITDNALTDNALTDNALTDNALTDNALTDNALTDNALTDNALEAISDPNAQGALNRELLQYIVACAFKPTQAFDFTWTDNADLVHDEHYVGQLGLAPQWNSGPLNVKGQHMVSACLAAKTNYYGVHVTISVRSGEAPLRLSSHSDELDDYDRVEGAFWGNLWAPQPYLNACYNSANVDNSRAASRDCATGHLNADGTIEECGIINVVGSCANVCKKYNASRGHYSDCRKQPGVSTKRTDLVITTALP